MKKEKRKGQKMDSKEGDRLIHMNQIQIHSHVGTFTQDVGRDFKFLECFG